jgi:hypothetical protein
MIVEGGCHCGMVRFDAVVEGPEVELFDCNCSICRMSGHHLHLIVPDTKFRLTEGQRDTTTYRFGTGRARHIFCQQCGVKSFFRPRTHPEGISLNWHCLDEDHGLIATITPFDGAAL